MNEKAHEWISDYLESEKTIEKAMPSIVKIEEIFRFFNNKNLGEMVFDPNIVKEKTVFKEIYIEFVGFLLEDKMLKIALFITENDNPEKKYSLCAIGRSLYSVIVGYFPYDAELKIGSWHFDIKNRIVDGHTVEEVKDWIAKNRENVLRKEIEEFLKFKSYHKDIINNFTVEDFDPLIKFKCVHCGYIMTKRQMPTGLRACIECSDDSPDSFR